MLQLPTGTLDQLLAPIALYPDQLLAQMLISATEPAKITELDKWLKSNQKLKGTQLQDAAVKAGFDASFVALVVFPQVVAKMAEQIAWTTVLGQSFTADRSAVFASIQKLRAQAKSVGSLKSTPQQEVETKKTSSGEEVIVIEPTNPQVVYVPQYNTQVVYTQAPTTVVIQEDDDDAEEAIAAGLIGFTAGIAIGAAMDNNYYYGPCCYVRWRLHVQRRLGRLLRPSRRRPGRLDGSPGGYRRGAQRSPGRSRRTSGAIASKTPRSSAPIVRRTARKTGPSLRGNGLRRKGRKRNGRSAARRRKRATERAPRTARHDADTSRLAPEVRRPAATAMAPRASDSPATERQLGRILGLFERTIATRVQCSWPAKPRQFLAFAQRRRRRRRRASAMMPRGLIALAFSCSLVALVSTAAGAQTSANRTFASAEEAVKALVDIVKKGDVDALLAVFGPDGKELIASSDPAAARQSRQVFAVAAREQWHLVDEGPDRKTLVIGYEEWPFPVPLVKGAQRMAVRHRGGEGRSAGAADRAQRAVGDRDHPSLCERAAALRAAGARRQAARGVRGEVPERPR